MKIYLGIPRYMNTKLDRFPTETVRLFQRINLINSRDISIKDFTMRSSTLNKTREERDTSRRSFRGALFDEDHKIHLRNWSSQRSLIHSSSLVAVYAVNSSFQNKPIDPRVPRQCHCTFGIPANDLHIFFFSLPFSRVYSRATRVSRGIYALYADVMNVHRTTGMLVYFQSSYAKRRIVSRREFRCFLLVLSFNCAKHEFIVNLNLNFNACKFVFFFFNSLKILL